MAPQIEVTASDVSDAQEKTVGVIFYPEANPVVAVGWLEDVCSINGYGVAVYDNATAAWIQVGALSAGSSPPAWTKTYSTALRTVANATAVAVATTGSTTTTPAGYTTTAQADAIPVAINALEADVLALKKALVALLDDCEAAGISG